MKPIPFLPTLIIAQIVGAVFLTFSTSACDADAAKSGTKLADLTAFCNKMRDIHRAIRQEIIDLHKAIAGRPDKKASAEDLRVAVRISEKESEAVAEMAKILERMKKDAVVIFPEVFEQVLEDMKELRSRLAEGDVAMKTQELATDVVETFAEMVNSLKSK